MKTVIDKMFAAHEGEFYQLDYQPQNADCVPFVLTCPADVSVPTDAGQCDAVVNYLPPIATGGVGNVTIGCQPPSGSLFPVGLTPVSGSATDANGAQVSCSFTVQVEDNEPPRFQRITASPTVLWPPNQAMVPVQISVIATDNCGSTTSKIVSVSSNELLSGSAKGDRASDWEITGDLTLKLRAERAGKASDRIYTITLEGWDDSGNSAQALLSVMVPHDQQSK